MKIRENETFENITSENLRNVSLDNFLAKLNEINMFNIPIKTFTGVDSKLKLKNVKILENKLYIDGIIVIKRNDTNGQKKEKK